MVTDPFNFFLSLLKSCSSREATMCLCSEQGRTGCVSVCMVCRHDAMPQTHKSGPGKCTSSWDLTSHARGQHADELCDLQGSQDSVMRRVCNDKR
jgi:hypothetical protein